MDLTTTYLGLSLPHPFIAGASPLCDRVDGARALEDAGAAAIVLRSLFEEQLRMEAEATYSATESHASSFAEALSLFPEPREFVLGPDDYLEHLARVKAAVDIPVVASLNGRSLGGWLDYARSMEQAGADALELNLYDIVTDVVEPGSAIEDRAVTMVREVARVTQLPLAVKLSPFYTSLPNMARRLQEAGARGLVLFNRFFEPEFDVEELEIVPHLELSTSTELRLRLRWLAILSPHLSISLAVTGGVHTALDAVKAAMSGAHAVQVVSALLEGGPATLTRLREEMARWLEEHEYDALAPMIGSLNAARCPNPTALERANYMQTLLTWR